MGKTVLIGDTHAQNCPFDWEKKLVSGLPINDIWLYRELNAAIEDEGVDTIIWSCSYPLMGVLKYQTLLEFAIAEVPIQYCNLLYHENQRGFYKKQHQKVEAVDYEFMLKHWLDKIEDFYSQTDKITPLPLAAHWYSWKLEYTPHAYESLLNRGIQCYILQELNTYERRFYDNEYGVLSVEGWEAISADNSFV